jgi:hypothetical protein
METKRKTGAWPEGIKRVIGHSSAVSDYGRDYN